MIPLRKLISDAPFAAFDPYHLETEEHQQWEAREHSRDISRRMVRSMWAYLERLRPIDPEIPF